MSERQKMSVLVMVTLIAVAIMSVLHAQPQEAREIPVGVAARLTEWYRYFIIWATLHYGLGATTTVLSVIVAAVEFSTDRKRVRSALAGLAATTAALLTLLTPAANAKAYIQAWRLLDSASRQYQVDTTIPLSKLNEAVDEGEKAIATGVIGAF